MCRTVSSLIIIMSKGQGKENPIPRRQAIRGKGTLEIHRLGPHPLIEHFIQRLDIPRILDKHIHSNRTGVISHGKTIGILIHNILTSNDPLYRVPDWAQSLEASALGLSDSQKSALNDDRAGRSRHVPAEARGQA